MLNLEAINKEFCLYRLLIEEQLERVRREPDWRLKFRVLADLGSDFPRTLPLTLSSLKLSLCFTFGLLSGWLLL